MGEILFLLKNTKSGGKLVPFEEKGGKRLVIEPKITSVLSYQFLNANNNLNFDCYPTRSMNSCQNSFCLGAHQNTRKVGENSFLNATNNLNFDFYPTRSMYSRQNSFCLGANSSFPLH